MRRDKDLPDDSLGSLESSDSDRFLIEWTYRIYEKPALVDSPEDFLKYLCESYERQAGSDYFLKKRSGQIRAFTNAFAEGHQTLQEWTENTRAVLTGEFREKERVLKISAERRADVARLYPHLVRRRPDDSV